jgi:glycosyltransferase involved in cell wall biosynthesis
MVAQKKILIFSEKLSLPIDEGIKKTAWTVLKELSLVAQVQGISRQGIDGSDPPLRIIQANKLLWDKNVREILRGFAPDSILYIPTSSGTLASFLRMWMLRHYVKSAKAVLLLLQPKPLSSGKARLLSFFKPDLVLSPSPQVLSFMSHLKISAEFLPLGADPDVFQPLGDEEKKLQLRKKYNLPGNKFIILHVGHINWGRNLEALLPLQRSDSQVVMVSSTSTPHDAPQEAALSQKMKQQGIVILDEYVEAIQELYQLSDAYVFPVIKDIGSIGIPLSILEARSCGIPVISTSFGGVKELLENKDDSVIFTQPDNFPEEIERLKKLPPSNMKSYNSRNMFLETLKNSLDISE